MRNFEYFFIDLDDEFETEAVAKFLQEFELSYNPKELEATLVIYQGSDIIASGSVSGNIIRNVAISKSVQGEGLLADVAQRLQTYIEGKGIYHFFVYTKAKTEAMFIDIGYKLIAKVDWLVSFLEFGNKSIERYLSETAKELPSVQDNEFSAIVMNCNPFTLGHQFLIEKAAAESKNVIVFVVSENRSYFKFDERFQLVKDGTAHLSNVFVVPSGDYAVSAATFPTYFLKKDNVETAQTLLDVTIFASRTAKALNITRRYVGTEPNCPTTYAYNEAMKSILPKFNLELVEIERKEQSAEVISATRVRALYESGDFVALEKLVPSTTLEYLKKRAQN